MKITREGYAVLDDDKDRLLSRYVEQTGRLDHDDGIAAYYLPHIQPGMTVVDAGAMVGDHTIAYAKKVGVFSAVHAFECNPDMVECLRYNCPQCHVYEVALSDGLEQLYYHANHENAGGSYCDTNPNDGLVVTVRTLDSFNLPKVGFIKWDLEGYEIKAIRGARETIMQGRPVMMIEVLEAMLRRAGGNAKELFDLLTELRYRWRAVLGQINDHDEYFELCCEPL